MCVYMGVHVGEVGFGSYWCCYFCWIPYHSTWAVEICQCWGLLSEVDGELTLRHRSYLVWQIDMVRISKNMSIELVCIKLTQRSELQGLVVVPKIGRLRVFGEHCSRILPVRSIAISMPAHSL